MKEIALKLSLLAVLVIVAFLLIGSLSVKHQKVTKASSIKGVVRQVGNPPFSRTIIDAGDNNTVTVVGGLESEIGRLVGAIVKVNGEFTESQNPFKEFMVSDYEIVSVGGERPVVGVLKSDSEGYYMQSESKIRLSEISPSLEDRIGVKIWAIISEEGVIERYGIINVPNSEESEKSRGLTNLMRDKLEF